MSEKRQKQYRFYFFSGGFFGMLTSAFLSLVFFSVQAQDVSKTPSLDAPSISVLSRETGGRGQFITIEGSNFGSVPGIVTFVSKGEAVNADTNFSQAACEKLYWRDRYIIAKVPSSLAPQQYKIKVRRPDGQMSNEKSFVVTNASPTPGICGILPDNGPVGITVKLYGDYFGRDKGRISIGSVATPEVKDEWLSTVLTTSIPAGDLGNGRIRILNASRTLSNQVPFTLGRCSAKSCDTGFECCGDGSCRPQGLCERKVYACTYSWTFSTGNLGVPIGGSCAKNEDCASSLCGPEKKCIRGDRRDGEKCTIDIQCIDGLKCEQGVCAPFLKDAGAACTTHTECLSGNCQYGICQEGSKTIGETCDRGKECASKNCYKGKCSQELACLKVLFIEPTGSSIARNSPFVIRFNQLIDEASLRGKVTIQPSIQGTISARKVGSEDDFQSEAVFTPAKLLTAGVKYNVKLGDSIKSAASDNTLGKCVSPGKEDSGECNAPNSKCLASGKCLPVCSPNDPPQCAQYEKICRDKATGGLYCRTQCKSGDSIACSSSLSCSATDSCIDCSACASQQRCIQQQCKVPNSLCSSGKCVLTCSPNDPPRCKSDQKTCEDQTTKQLFCASSCTPPAKEVCLSPKTTCASGACREQCPKDDVAVCTGGQKTCLDPATGGTFCALSCTPPAQEVCSSSAQCSQNDSCTTCQACKQAPRCIASESCKTPNNICSDGQCLPQCPPGNPVKCSPNQIVCKNSSTGATFCHDGSTCPPGSTQACSSPIACSTSDSCADCSACKEELRCKTGTTPPGTTPPGTTPPGTTPPGTTPPVVPPDAIISLEKIQVLVDGSEKTTDLFTCLKGSLCSTAIHSYTVKAFGKNSGAQEVEIAPKSIQWKVSAPLQAEGDQATLKTATVNISAAAAGSSTVEVTVIGSLVSGTSVVDVTKTATISVRICTKPWNYLNADYDFSLYYCADEGGQIMPSLEIVPTNIPRNNDPYERELIFQFDPASIPAADPSATSSVAYNEVVRQEKLKTDVFVIRIAKNKKNSPSTGKFPYAPSPGLWYTEMSEGKTPPSATIIDGYRSFKESTGSYVGAYNGTANDFYAFYFTVNANASPETLQVYNRLLAGAKFSLTKGNEAEKLRRDAQRLDDISQIKKRLDDYHQANVLYPSLLAGSYLAGQTTSLWPSWQQAFGADLKAALPLDPVKKICQAPYDTNTCWDNAAKRFMVASDDGKDVLTILKGNQSFHAYAYKTSNNGVSYELCTNLESTTLKTQWSGGATTYCISQ